MVLKSPQLTVSEECIYSIHCGLFLFSVCVWMGVWVSRSMHMYMRVDVRKKIWRESDKNKMSGRVRNNIYTFMLY